jgi:phenylpropionate dioxygenase-like ring-hydroxylating dioxygenase large terminal subunit
MDPHCEPLRDYLEPAASMLDPFELEKMRYRRRLWCHFDCNWKTAMEAFIESFHVEGTHPQLLKYADFYVESRSDGNHSHQGFEERNQNADMSASNTIIRAGKGADPRVSLAELQEESVAHGYTFALCFRVRPQGYNPDRCIFEAFVLERFPERQEPNTEWVYAEPTDVGK